MTDIIDLAQEREAANMAQSLLLQAASASRSTRPKAVGYCLNGECETAFTDQPARLFCGPACAKQYEIQLKE